MVGCIFGVLSFPLTGTPLDAVPVPGAILTRSPRATHSSSPPVRRPFPHPIKYSIYFINYTNYFNIIQNIFILSELYIV